MILNQSGAGRGQIIRDDEDSIFESREGMTLGGPETSMPPQMNITARPPPVLMTACAPPIETTARAPPIEMNAQPPPTLMTTMKRGGTLLPPFPADTKFIVETTTSAVTAGATLRPPIPADTKVIIETVTSTSPTTKPPKGNPVKTPSLNTKPITMQLTSNARRPKSLVRQMGKPLGKIAGSRRAKKPTPFIPAPTRYLTSTTRKKRSLLRLQTPTHAKSIMGGMKQTEEEAAPLGESNGVARATRAADCGEHGARGVRNARLEPQDRSRRGVRGGAAPAAVGERPTTGGVDNRVGEPVRQSNRRSRRCGDRRLSRLMPGKKKKRKRKEESASRRIGKVDLPIQRRKRKNTTIPLGTKTVCFYRLGRKTIKCHCEVVNFVNGRYSVKWKDGDLCQTDGHAISDFPHFSTWKGVHLGSSEWEESDFSDIEI